MMMLNFDDDGSVLLDIPQGKRRANQEMYEEASVHLSQTHLQIEFNWSTDIIYRLDV
jgi:hypothetical protein